MFNLSYINGPMSQSLISNLRYEKLTISVGKAQHVWDFNQLWKF